MDVFRLVGRFHGKTIEAKTSVRSRIEAKRLSGNFSQLMNQVAEFSGTDWFVVGDMVHVTNMNSRKVRMIPLEGLEASKAQKLIEEAQFYNPRFEVTGSTNGKHLYVTAPPKYLVLVEETLGGSGEEEEPAGGIKLIKFGKVVTK